MVNPTWEERDLPVLKAVVDLYEESGGIRNRPSDVSERTGFDEETVERALRALHPDYVTVNRAAEGMVLFFGAPTADARRAVGLWPTPEALARRLVAELEKAADKEPDEERRGWLRKTAGWLGGTGKQVAVDVAAAVISRQISGGA